MSDEKYKKLAELEKQHAEARRLADSLYSQVRKLEDEIAADKSKFPVGAVIAVNKTKWVTLGGYGHRAKREQKPYQEKYRIKYIGERYVLANRIKKDGSEGAEKRLYSWDINKAELVEQSK